MNKIAVIGVGNYWRGDDAVGILTARGIKLAMDSLGGSSAASCASVIESDGEITTLLECFQAFDRVYLIDAIQTGSARVGQIFDFDGITHPLRELTLSASTHVLGVAQSIEMARALGRLPSVLRVFGIEAAQFEHGSALSKEVKAASQTLTQRIVDEIRKETRADA